MNHLNLKPQNSKLLIRITTFILLIQSLIIPGRIMAQNNELRIGIMADIQYCNCETAGTRFYRLSLGKLDEAVKELVKEKVDFTVLLGDVIDRDFESFKTVFDRLKPLEPKVVFIPGNHDFNVADSLKDDVRKMLPAKRGYWSEARQGVRLVYLNGFVNSVVAWPKGTKNHKEGKEILDKLALEKAKNASDWNGGFGKKQLDWLKGQVELANANGEKLVLFGHQPVVPFDEHSAWDTDELLDIVSGYRGIVPYFCGHKHSGGDHQTGNCRIINLKGMVEDTTNAFCILEIQSDRYIIKGFGRQDSLIIQR